MTDNQKKIKATIKRYENALAKEKKTHGTYDDGYGKRYLLGMMYLQIDDVPGAMRHFIWFENEFNDDNGEPFQYLFWSLTLYRSGKVNEAEEKLRQTILRNLYIIPILLGEKIADYRIKFHSSEEYLDYVTAGEAPSEYFDLWMPNEKKWVSEFYRRKSTQDEIKKYVEINRKLDKEPVGDKRSVLVNEKFAMLKPRL